MTKEIHETCKPFVVLKRKKELLRAEQQGQLSFEKGIQEKLDKIAFVDTVVAATVSITSPSRIVAVESVKTPKQFLELAF